jgi:hypothetical protein
LVADALGLLARPWNFDVTDARVPCCLWHGEQDCTVPAGMCRRPASLMPGCSATFLSGEDHFSPPVQHGDKVLKALPHRC